MGGQNVSQQGDFETVNFDIFVSETYFGIRDNFMRRDNPKNFEQCVMQNVKSSENDKD